MHCCKQTTLKHNGLKQPFFYPFSQWHREWYVVVSDWTFHSHASDVYVDQNGLTGVIGLELPFFLSVVLMSSPPVVSGFLLLYLFSPHGFTTWCL